MPRICPITDERTPRAAREESVSLLEALASSSGSR